MILIQLKFDTFNSQKLSTILKKFNDSEDYVLHMKGRVKGGGPIGAAIGAWLFGGAVAGAGALAIGAASAATGPAVVPAAGALTFWFATPIAACAKAAAIGGGILGGILTGPF